MDVTRLAMLVAFLAGTLCGAASTMWHPKRNAGVPAGWTAAVPMAQNAAAPAGETPALHERAAARAVVVQPVRNLFAYFEPPPPSVETRHVLPTVAVPAMIAAAQPLVIEPPSPPPFPYRYVGTFGPRDNAFAVFARQGEVVDIRVGDTIVERFTLRHIGIESVDLSWGGPSDLRVPLTPR